MAHGPCLIGLDVGMTNLKAAAFSVEGRLLATVDEPTKPHREGRFDLNGTVLHATMDPDDVASSVVRLLTELLRRQECGVFHVAVTGPGGPMVAVGRDGHPVGPVIGLGTGGDPRDLDAAILLDEDLYLRTTGYPRSYHPAMFRLAWMLRVAPSLRDRIVRVMSLEDYIAYKLSGEMATERSTAAASGGWDHDQDRWSEAVLRAADVDPQWFAKPVLPGTVLAECHLDWPHAANGYVYVGGHDYLCAALAANVLGTGDCLSVLGTHEMVMRPFPLSGWPSVRLAGISSGIPVIHDAHVIPGVVTYTLENIAGGQIEWLRNLMAQIRKEVLPLEEFQAWCEEAGSQAARGVRFVPFLPHQMFPPWARPHTGRFEGLGMDTDPKALARALLEGVAYAGVRMLETLDEIVGEPSQRVVIAGGGTRNRLWTQLKADFLGRAVEVHGCSETSALGVALLAGCGAGYFSSLPEAGSASLAQIRVVEPQPSAGRARRDALDAQGWFDR